MSHDPQPATYRPDPAILPLAPWLGDRVEPATFPAHYLRFRNDRWARAVGLDGLDDIGWIDRFARFAPLEGNLARPLALRYHGHQFRVYNPEIGDGRGFLYAQVRDGAGRLLDFGTKGSGTTPYSRTADGRLTLKGAVREILATEMLEALGVYTSKTFSVVETGESLWRGDEPSPTRSAVLTRLNHGHIRIGTFQRLLALEEAGHMAQLVDYCLANFPGPPAPGGAPGGGEPAVRLLHQVVERLADLAAGWRVAGFVHGVLNTDNMNISGESFDYGPWRFLPGWDADFVAAYFDHGGLYSFGRQAEALFWNCGQLAVALRLLADGVPLKAALDRFAPLYEAALRRRWCWRMGVAGRGVEADRRLVALSEETMRENGWQPDAFFHAVRRGATPADTLTGRLGAPLADLLSGYERTGPPHPWWRDGMPQSMLIDEVETIWAAIAERDDWQPLERKVAAIRAMGEACGPAPTPLGHGDAPAMADG